MYLNNHQNLVKIFSKSKHTGWYCVLLVFASILFLIKCAPEPKKAKPTNQQGSYHGSASSTAPVITSTSPKVPKIVSKPTTIPNTRTTQETTPALEKKPSIRLTIPTQEQTTKAYEDTLTAFTYQEIISLVFPTNPAALNIASITNAMNQPAILTANTDTKTLTFANIHALTKEGQPGIYTVNFASETHQLNPPSLDIVFTVKKGYRKLSMTLVKEVCSYENTSAKRLWKEAEIVQTIEKHPSSNDLGINNFALDTADTSWRKVPFNKLTVIKNNRSDKLEVVYLSSRSPNPPTIFGKAIIPFTFDAPGIIKGHARFEFDIQSLPLTNSDCMKKLLKEKRGY